MRDSSAPLTACEKRAKVSVALAREASRLAAALLRDDDDPRALDDHEKRIRFLAFAGLRLLEPAGRSIEQAELVGFDALDALRACSKLGEFRSRARSSRSSHRGHWLTEAREAAVADGLRAWLLKATIAEGAEPGASDGEESGAREPGADGGPILRVVSGPKASAPLSVAARCARRGAAARRSGAGPQRARSRERSGTMTENSARRHYVLGFVFDAGGAHVLLIEKARPSWQAGRLNGIGGRIENGEGAFEAMSREMREESGVDLDGTEWVVFAELVYRAARVKCFALRGSAYCRAVTSTDERLARVAVASVRPGPRFCSGVSFLVPLARHRLFEESYAPLTLLFEGVAEGETCSNR
jgi:8-oxo-dGTP diphosphatase